MTSIALLVVGAVAAAVAVVWAEGHRGPGSNASYVALGSSFAAGPGIGERKEGSPHLCMRSAENYAGLLARMRGYDLVDATCSGATVADVIEGGQFFTPAQVDAVGPDTELVTITIGGNDVSYIGNVTAWGCDSPHGRTPLIWRGLSCETTTRAEEDDAFASLEQLLTHIVAAIRARSPDATIVFVDYVTVLPADDSCDNSLALTSAQRARASLVGERLAAATARVAEREQTELVAASQLTRDHHLCSTDPWVSGYEFPPSPLDWGRLPYHPTADAFQAIALALDDLLPPRR